MTERPGPALTYAQQLVVEADQEPGPSTDEVVEHAWRAIEHAWETIAQLVGTSWKKPEAADRVISERYMQSPPDLSDVKTWQSIALSDLLVGISAANMPKDSNSEADDAAPAAGPGGVTTPRRSERPRGPECSFCGKAQNRVEKLIQGPDVQICNECVELCSELITEQPGPISRPTL